MTKQFRWACPNGCAAVLAPSRLRKIDVRRYCLTCSERTGLLVERVSPLLERIRAVKRKRSQEKTARKLAREREKTRPYREAQRKARTRARREQREYQRNVDRLTTNMTSKPGPGWIDITNRDVDQWYGLGLQVAAVGNSRFGHAWAYELFSNPQLRDDGDPYWIFAMIKWITKKPKLVDALFAAGSVNPIWALEMAFDHYTGPIAAGVRQNVRELAAKLRPRSDGSAFVTVVS